MATREQILRSRQLDIKLALRRRLLLEAEEGALPVPTTHTLTVGTGGANLYGFDSLGPYGALAPSADRATTVEALATSATDLRYAFAGGASPYGTNEVTAEVRIYIEGAPSTFYDLTWVAGFSQEYRYSLPDSALIDYLTTQVGNDLQVAVGAVP